MNKVLFIGPYRDGTGYGHAATEYILAMDTVGINVVPRPLKLNDKIINIPPRLLELEQQNEQGCNIVIQNTLPHMFDYDGHFDKNIGLFFTECSDFASQRDWVRSCNTMDELWVASRDSINHVQNSNVDTPVFSIPIPCDPGKYAKKYDLFPIPELQNRFTFYFIAEYSRRKNLTALLKAFHLEFHKREEVELLLKISVPNRSKQEAIQHIVDACIEIKTMLELYDRMTDYKEEYIVCEELSDDEMMEIHTLGNCLVAPSFAESWCMSAFDAMAMGKTPICSNVGGIRDFIDNTVGTLLPANPQPVFGMKPWTTVPNLYTGRQTWWDVDVQEMQKAMRKMYEEQPQDMINAGIDRAYKFSREVIGEQIKEMLNEKR